MGKYFIHFMYKSSLINYVFFIRFGVKQTAYMKQTAEAN